MNHTISISGASMRSSSLITGLGKALDGETLKIPTKALKFNSSCPEMGNCDSASAEMNKRSRKINAIIEYDKKAEETVIKLLLLGAGESGKSTILKQMKIIHDNGFSQDEATQKISVVCANTVQSIGALIDGMKALNIPFASKQSTDYAALIKKTLEKKEEFQPLTEEMYKAIKTLWNDKGIEAAYERRDEYYLHDSAKYFLDSLDRIYDKNFVPTEQDILRTRIATMGVIEVCFTMKNKLWRVFDVGGQRSQRKKWIHCFDDAKAVIYVASLSEYDQVLLEDDTTVSCRITIALI
ncbi:hypothetical protein Y032_0058g2915 [Ancylostoma ceylanicum]|uniref:G-protein alpha subunit n=4 Tax=Ancylostoma TaxID=29169 RepID=A0A016U4V3_9BILA|nr:hypothetical protein Y032_0058g2915 [Ancylostoma ceylanicum]